MKRIKKKAVIRCAGASAWKSGTESVRDKGSCEAIRAAFPEGARACVWGCLGGGSCVAACRLHAISLRENGSAVVDKEKCVGCGLCVKACPQHLISLVPAENVIQPFCAGRAAAKETRLMCGAGCIGCRICEKACPAGAIHVTDNRAVIDQSRCIACGMCAAKCPRGVIHDANGILAER